MTTTVTPLVISYGGTLRSLVRGTVTLAELAQAVFYFGCERDHFFDEACAYRELETERAVSEADLEIWRSYRELIVAAEAAGRVGWRQAGESSSWAQLNALLESNHLPAIDPWDEDEPQMGRYNYPAVETAVRMQQLPYAVVWTRH